MLSVSSHPNLSPVMLSGGFAILNVVTFYAAAQITYGFLFSFDYFFWVLCVSGVAFPLGVIVYSVLKAKWAWWSVVLACVISAAGSATHFLLILAAAAVV